MLQYLGDKGFLIWGNWTKQIAGVGIACWNNSGAWLDEGKGKDWGLVVQP